MAMRQDCKHFQSRTYASGDTMRKCVLDLAPEAPWNCPEDCGSYERRLADVNWRHGTLVTPPTPAAPPSVGEDDSVSALLDEAENIINSVGPTIRAEVEKERHKKGRFLARGTFSKRRWWRFGR
jgi:hypothetical protein